MTTFSEWADQKARRAAVVSRNKSRRLKGLPPLPLPPEPLQPYYWEIVEADGTYFGTVRTDDREAAEAEASAVGLTGYKLRRVKARN